MSHPPRYIMTADEIAEKKQSFSHPWNPKSQIEGTMLARACGLKRVGINWAVIQPGAESFVYHRHMREEEWIYILSGTAVVEIEGDSTEIGPGTFVAFPAGVAHHLRNPGSQELVYLMGGEQLDAEIADFPKLGRRMVRVGEDVQIFKSEDAKPFAPLDP